MLTIVTIRLMNRLLLILGSDQCFLMALSLLSAFPPAPYNHEDDVGEIERDKKAFLPWLDRPSLRMIRSKDTAMVKKPTSRRKGPRATLMGLMMYMEPTTQETMNDAAPMNPPMAKLPEPARIAENMENTLGLPFPNAGKVTPATFSSRPKLGDSGEVWSEEIRSSDAEGGKEEEEPENESGEIEGTETGRRAKVSLEIVNGKDGISCVT